MGLSVNTSMNLGMNTGIAPSENAAVSGNLGALDEESQSKIEEMQEKFESIRGAAKGMEKFAEEAPRATKQMILGNMCKQIEAMNPRLYTADTWNALMKAYGGAKKLLNQDAPTDKQLQKAVEALRKAIARLEMVERRKQKEEDEEREGFPIVVEKQGKSGEDAAVEQAVATAEGAVAAAAAAVASAAGAAGAAAPSAGAAVDVSV